MTKTNTFDITGMHCAGCAQNITKEILKIKGVKSAQVSPTTEKVKLEYNSQQIDWQALEKAVSSIGSYQIHIPQNILGIKSPNHDHSMDQREMNAHKHHDHAQTLKDEQLKTLKNKMILAGVFSLLILAGEIFKFLPREISFILTSIVLFYAGNEFYQNTWSGLKHFIANMDTLVAMGTGAAYLYSTIITFWPQIFQGENAVYFDTASIIVTLILLGRFLEAKAKGRASEAIQKLLHLQVKKAVVLIPPKNLSWDKNNSQLPKNLDKWTQSEINLVNVVAGDIILVKPGGKIPVDGQIIIGESYIDESLITGESKPVKKKAGDKVIGSTINSKGSLTIRATGVGEETILNKIIQMVQEAQGSQAPIQKLADKVSGIFVPIVIGIATLTFLIWYFMVGVSFTTALVIFITVLIISCPCALGLATPISIMVGTGRGAEQGILIKNAEKLQIAGNIQAIALDKTGTLTQGSFSVTDIGQADINPKWTQKEILSYIAALERDSEHPIATAVISKAKEMKLKLPKVEKFSAIEGKGIRGIINGKKIMLGTRTLMKEEKQMRCTVLDTLIDNFKDQGKTIAYLSVDNKTVGGIALADQIKPQTKNLIAQLNKLNIDTWMITGDNQQTAQAVAKQIGITNIMAEVLPNQKANKIKELQKKYAVVAMTGDGVNDAPALAVANVGIAMATGTDIAMETADITLLRGDLNLIAEAISLSKKTMTNIKQNLFWAFGYNTLLIPIAAGILIPIGFQIQPVFASAAMAFSSISVVLNALRLRRA